LEKSSPRIGATSVIFNKLAKENNRPMENSPNLVTLLSQAKIEEL
jgi:type III secretion system FlhB-like substrate exporter